MLKISRRQAVALELDRVVVVEAVEPHHLVAPVEQPLARMKADETGGAGDENAHGLGP